MSTDTNQVVCAGRDYNKALPSRLIAGVARWGTSSAMELILFPTYFYPSMGKYVFHGGAVELGRVLVEFPIREDTLSECVCCCLLVAEWNVNLLPIEATDIVSERLSASLLDTVEVA